MVALLIGVYTLYLLIRLYASVMQIGFINRVKTQGAVLMSDSAYRDAASYAVAKEKLSMLEVCVEYGLFLVWMMGLVYWVDQTLIGYSMMTQSIVAVLGLLLFHSVVMLPFGWIAKFKIDAQYGFNRSSLGQFIKDTLISTLLMIVVGGLIIAGVSWIITSSTLWWLWSFSFIFAIVVGLNMFFPTIRALFFDTVTPLEQGELREKIEELMTKTGFVSSGIFVSDASKRDARLNAYFGGLGKTKRVILFDTLIAKLSPQELVAVLGHELGHFAHGDLYKNIAMVGGMLLGMFAFFGNLPQGLFLELGVAPSPHVLMMLFILTLPLVSFVVMPLMGMMSRHNEYEADKTGASLGGVEHLVNALKKLVSENKSFPLSHPLYRFLYTTHPPVVERLQALGAVIAVQTTTGYEDPCPND
ncbi:MAG: M48 family metallopeptidase [Sulfuricurvum sp.]